MKKMRDFENLAFLSNNENKYDLISKLFCMKAGNGISWMSSSMRKITIPILVNMINNKLIFVVL